MSPCRTRRIVLVFFQFLLFILDVSVFILFQNLQYYNRCATLLKRNHALFVSVKLTADIHTTSHIKIMALIWGYPSFWRTVTKENLSKEG